MTNSDEIDTLKRELRTDKITTRQKAFTKLSFILTSQRAALNKLFQNNKDSEFTYDRLFYCAHEGVKIQGFRLNDNDDERKTIVYSKALEDLVSASIDNSAPSHSVIKSDQFIESVNQILVDENLLKHFGNTYLNLLSNVLNANLNLTSVQCSDWKDLLKCLLKILKSNDPKFRFLFLLGIAQKVVIAGCDYSYLAFELLDLKIFESIKTILDNSSASNDSNKNRQETLVLTYYCCRYMAIDYRFELCRFLEDITEFICNAFVDDVNRRYRHFFIKLMDLSLILHIPNLGKCDQQQIEYIHDKDKWNYSLRRFDEMLLIELKFIKNHYQNQNVPPKVCSYTREFASRYCYYAYWNDDVWRDEKDSSSEASSKRVKYTNKLQTIVERVSAPADKPTDFNWKWLMILCELISDYPETIQNDDVASILTLLSECQHLIENKEQIYAFTKCCSVLLEQEENFQKTANKIVYSHCQTLWMKISDEAARCCSNSNKNLKESHYLLQLLIYHQKYSSNAFIEGVLKIFTSHSTVKCDTTLKTLIVLLKSFNIDSLSNGKELTKQILKFSFEKITFAVLKKMIAENEKPSYKILAQFSVLCCLLKTDVINFFKNVQMNSSDFYGNIIDLDEQNDYKSYINAVIHSIQLKARNKLIIEDDDFAKLPEKLFNKDKKDVPVELKCMIDEDIFVELMKQTELPEKVIGDQNSAMEIKDYLKDVIANNELMMNLLSELLIMEAMNQNKIDNLFITKRIVLNMQEIDRIFAIVSSKNIEFDVTDAGQITTSINSMLSNRYHSAVGKLVRSNSLRSCLNWLFKQVERDFGNPSETTNSKLNLKAFSAAKIEYKMRYHSVTTLCEYFNYEGADTDYAAKLIDEIDFTIEDNIDVHTIFKAIEIFGQQATVPELAAVWIWEAGIINICQVHKHNLYVLDCLISRLPELKQFTHQHNGLRKNYTTVFQSFNQLCTLDAKSIRFFAPQIVVKYLKQFKYFHEGYFTAVYNDESVKHMYANIYKDFLHSKSFDVKMAAISCFSTILHSDIENCRPIDEQKLMNHCRKNLFNDFITTYEYSVQGSNQTDNDHICNDIATHIQLFVSLFCANFNYREHNLFELTKIFINFNLCQTEGFDIFAKILKKLNCQWCKSVVSLDDIVDLLTKWINLSMEMCKFPWYLIGSKSYEEFLNNHYNMILLSALKTKGEVVDDFLESIELRLNDAAIPVMSACLAFLIPNMARCKIRYESDARQMSVKLATAFSDDELENLLLEKVPEVIVKLLSKVVDNHKFLEISGFQMDFSTSLETIKFNDFEKCMTYIKDVVNIPAGEDLMTHLCNNYLSTVQDIFMRQKKNIQATELKERKILSFLHYNLLINETVKYMNDADVADNKSIKEYLAREIGNYLCYLIVSHENGSKLSMMAADSLLNYLKAIIPACCQEFKSQLQKIVPKLVAICKKPVCCKLKAKCLEIMHFLIFAQKSMIKDEISVLDRFPASSDFDELRQAQLDIKYHDGDFTLLEEIENFLEIEDRRIEGLTALYEHLSAKKDELKYLFVELDTITDDKSNSTIHRLIRMLIMYIRQNDEERAVEAIKCLGEIGCHNIATIVFNVEDRDRDTTYLTFENVLHCQRYICEKVLKKLEETLTHQDVTIFEVSSHASYYILRSASSMNLSPSAFFRPFVAESRTNENLFYIEPKDDKVLILYSLLTDDCFLKYATFIKGFCVNMIEYAGDKVLGHLIPVRLEFAEMIFPLIFHLLLLYDNESVNKEILRTLVYFFEQSFEKLNNAEHTHKGSIFINKKIIRQMLKLIEKIRIFCQDNPKSKMAAMQNFNYLHIAKAAKHCEASFTAIQYCEMWARKRQELENSGFSNSLKDKTLQEIMYRSYSAIGIKDASDVFLNPATNRTEYLLNNGLNFQSLVEISKDAPIEDFMKLLNDVDLYHISNRLNETVDASKRVQNYECLWRLSEWNTIVDADAEIKDEKGLTDYRGEFEKFHYLCLQYSKNNDAVGLRTSLYKGRKMILQLITHQILECSNNLYKFLEMSHRFAQIEDFSEVLFKRSVNTHELLLKKWNVHDELPNDYEHNQTVFLQRNSILSTANIKAGKRKWIPDVVQSNSLFLIKQSVLADRHDEAIGLIARLRDTITATPRKMEVLIEEAKLNINKNQDIAKNCLLQIMGNKQTADEDLIIQSTAHRIYGEILAETFSEDVAEIFKNYFKISMDYLDKYAQFHQKSYLVAKLDDPNEMSQFSQELSKTDKEFSVESKIRQASCIYDTIAKYYDREYEFKATFIASPDFVQRKANYAKNVERIKTLKPSYNTADEDARRSYHILSKSAIVDKQQIENIEKEKKSAARNAIYYYIRSTIYSSDDNILNIFRIVALMLANFNSIKFVEKVANDLLLKIPSYKFIVALPQITVRLNQMRNDPLNKLLKDLLTSCAKDHPHHTLPLILALVNSYKDSNDVKEDEPRVVGAKDLWNSLKNEESLKKIMKEMEMMSTALIDLANLPLKTSSMPANHRVLALKRLTHVQCPTIELPIVKNGDYKKCLLTVEKWEPQIKSVGGINAPKRIEVLCSDGVRRPQLLKGKDDMRQDAIMQQIFGVVNNLLALDKNMRKNHARIRTYKVVPFSRRSGILEWCENTIPIGSYLVGERDGKLFKKGAHQVYRPKDWPPKDCIDKVSEISSISDVATKVEKFNDICSHIQPVFHQFFYEKFKSIGEHFERRIAYTMSVAVSSMIGYILGIGDRHVQNILVDLKTAELIHIDFGVAFEQGKILPHPELIPFRLTRDIVAPFGVSGVDGIFRKACEKTIKILRDNQMTLTTILEVLLYDPMYMWSVGANQARRSQLGCDDDDDCSMENVEHDLMASRALNCVKMKLKGMAENSSARYPSIEGQVQYLIQAATNPVYLSQLFKGWQAYL